jgi:hypothetical protein
MLSKTHLRDQWLGDKWNRLWDYVARRGKEAIRKIDGSKPP